jgi:hypothetical protein
MLKWFCGTRRTKQATDFVDSSPQEFQEPCAVEAFYPPSEFQESRVVDGLCIWTHVTTFRGAVNKIEMHIFDFNVRGYIFMKDEEIQNVDKSEKDYQVPFRYAGAEIGSCKVKVRVERGLVQEFLITEVSVLNPEM